MSSHDDLLVTFVNAANHHDFSLDVTLNVNGALVSGTTISAESYLESLAHKFEGGNELSQTISKKLSDASQFAKEQEEASYIHLKNTQIYNGDKEPTPSKESFLWRGKLDKIDGFFIGRISTEDE